MFIRAPSVLQYAQRPLRTVKKLPRSRKKYTQIRKKTLVLKHGGRRKRAVNSAFPIKFVDFAKGTFHVCSEMNAFRLMGNEQVWSRPYILDRSSSDALWLLSSYKQQTGFRLIFTSKLLQLQLSLHLIFIFKLL